MNKQRPKHLDLHLVQLPLPGSVPILHRISGLLPFFALPLLLLMLQYSLRSIGWISQRNKMMVGRDHQIGRSRRLYIGATRRDYVPAGQR